MRIRAGLPTGVTALMFDAAQRRRALEARLSGRLTARGFQEMLLPIMDYFEPYANVLLPEVQSQLYRFVDRDGQLLALRGDFTPMLARLLKPRLGDLELPLQLFYRGDVVRYQEARPGRLREYSQLGAEHIAPPNPGDDEMMLDLFLELLVAEARPSADDQPDLEVVLGVSGALDALLLAHEARAEDLVQALRTRDREAARSAGAALLETVESGRPKVLDVLGERAARDVGRALELAARLETRYAPRGARVTVDLAEFADCVLDDELVARGLGGGYYDGLVFRAFLRGNAQPAGGGGRYDRLFGNGEGAVGAFGFFLGLDRLLEQPDGVEGGGS